jgi:hypothetical protein
MNTSGHDSVRHNGVALHELHERLFHGTKTQHPGK